MVDHPTGVSEHSEIGTHAWKMRESTMVGYLKVYTELDPKPKGYN
jgi:hypothetical protein